MLAYHLCKLLCKTMSVEPSKSLSSVCELYMHYTRYLHAHVLTQTGYLYTRWGNPTVDAAADVIARLEGAAGTLLFSSGCAAITTALISFAKAGDHIVS